MSRYPITVRNLLEILKERSEEELDKVLYIYDDTVGDYHEANGYTFVEGNIAIIFGEEEV